MKAFLIDYEWCTGCHSCEVACQMINEFPPGEFGIKLSTYGPWPFGDDQWQFDNAPFITRQCTGCVALVAEGKQPSCVQHCQAQCLTFGELDELAGKLANKPWQIIQCVG